MKRYIIISVIAIILIIAAAVAVFAMFGSPKNGGTTATTATTEATTAEPVPPEIPTVTDGKYFNFTAVTSESSDKGEYTYYIISAKSVDDLPEELVIPSEYNGCEVRFIAENGFAGAKIKKVYISGNIDAIYREAFYGCTELCEVVVSDIDGVVFFNSSVFEGCEKLKSVVIYNVPYVDIGEYSFKNCTSLEKFELQKSEIYYIEKYAFGNGTSLKSFNITKNTRGINTLAFHGCSNISITVDPENTYFYSAGDCIIQRSNKGLVWCKSAESIPTDGSVTHIEDFTFLEDMGVTEYVMPDFIESIGYGDIKNMQGGFINCKSLESIVLSKNLKKVNGNAFYGLENLKKVDLASVEAINMGAFDYCTALCEIVWSDKLEQLCSFNGCDALTEAVIPEGVKNISYAFSNCKNLSKLTVPESAEQIYVSFNECPLISNVAVPANVKDISVSFSECPSLSKVDISEGVQFISSSFKNCDLITKIVIPSTVERIDESFSSCKLLSNVELKNSVLIENQSFNDCPGIIEFAVPEGTSDINHSLQNCANLRKLTLPKSIAKVVSSFMECPFLMDIYYGGTIDEWKTVNVGSLTGATIVHCTDGDIRLENSHPKAG